MAFVGRQPNPTDSQWWQPDRADSLAADVVAAAQAVDMATSVRRMRILKAYALYGDDSAIPEASLVAAPANENNVTRNILALAVDTVLAEVTQTRPRPMFVTIGGDWFDQDRARKLSYHCDAVYDEHEVRGLAEQITRDAIIAGLGILRPRINPKDGKSLLIERVFPANFLVDDRGAIDVMPRNFYVRHLIDKWHLAELYPEQAEDILKAAQVSHGAWFSEGPRSTDMVEVIEAFHLPSRADGSDGKHVLAIAECVLLDEPYTYDDPPFVFVRAIRPLRGFWGISLVQRAAPTQTELNRVLRRFNDALRLNATTRYWLQRQARVVKSHIVNKVGAIIEYDGDRPPLQDTPAILHPQVIEYMDRAETRIFKLMGASELAATSLKPAGLNSGRALTVYNDVQSRRFIHLERQYEGIFVDLARWLVRLEKQIAKEHPEYKVLVRDKLRTVELDWSKVDLDDDAYRVRIFPASAFPNDPAAKIEMLQEMVRDGVIDHQQFYELALDVPDLESVRNRIVAPLELLHQRFARMLESGKYMSPEPYMNLALALRECALALQRAELEEVPEDRCDLLRRFISDTVTRQRESAPEPPPPPPPGPGGMPMGGPGPFPGPLPPGLAIPGGPPMPPMAPPGPVMPPMPMAPPM